MIAGSLDGSEKLTRGHPCTDPPPLHLWYSAGTHACICRDGGGWDIPSTFDVSLARVMQLILRGHVGVSKVL